MTGRPWTTADQLDLERLTAADLSDYAIGRRLGRTTKAVAARRKQLGLRKHGETRRRVLALLRKGWPTWEIALAVGRSEQTVRAVRAAKRLQEGKGCCALRGSSGSGC